MKNQKSLNMVSLFVRFGLCVALAFSTLLTPSAQAQNSKAWTSVASAGTVNDQDQPYVELSGGGLASLNNAAPDSHTAFIRFNVTAVDGLFVAGYPQLRVRFQDNGANAQVVVSLMEYDFKTATLKKILELDSNDFASAPGLQTQKTDACAAFALTSFNFTDKAYYIDAKLIRTGAGGVPRLAVVQVYNNPASCVG
ncbi:MAG: hypothetical protein SF339_05790 [Blastocatellia bacterium]|nr:hypothetical protein [Blastocatellia bacterium]